MGNKADASGAVTASELRAALLRGLPRDACVSSGTMASVGNRTNSESRLLRSGGIAGAANVGTEPAGWGPPRDCRIVCCSALQGEGVRDAIDWLVRVTTKNHYAALSKG